MKNKIHINIILIVLSSFLLSVTIKAQEAGYKTKSINVEKGGSLKMKVQYGDIIVTTWDKNEISVKYEYDEDTGDAVSIEKSGNTVTITSNQKAFSDEYEISVPKVFNINLSTQGGNVLVKNDINGKIDLSTSGGEISLHKVKGDVKLSTAGGDIKTGDLDGQITLNTAGGDIDVGSVGYGSVNTAGGNITVVKSNKSLKVHTAGGNVGIGNVGGEIEVFTGGGNIEVGEVKGDATLKTGGGNINLNGASGKIEIKTGGGNIELNNINGAVEAKTGAGDIKLELNPSGNSSLKTSYGNITLLLPTGAKADVEAAVRSSSWFDESDKGSSDITSDYPAATFDKRGSGIKATYIINGGGNKIELITQTGSINIKKLNK